jgi:hypothetical protein
MMAEPKERTRLIIDTEDILRRAVHLRRLKMAYDTSVSDVVNEILREALAQEIREVEAYMRQEKKKRGGEQ